MDSWDFSSTLSLSVRRSLSPSQTSLLHSDDVSHTPDPVFELDEDRASDKGQPQDDGDKSEDSSPGPCTPAAATPVLAGLSSPPKDEPVHRVLSVSPGDGPKSDLQYNPPPPTTAPIPTRVTHTRSTSRSAPGSPTGLDDVPLPVPQSAPSDKASHGSKLWNKLTRQGSTRGKKFNAALDMTGSLVRVMSSGFASKPPKT
jgi:hypothetical protein